MSLRTLINDEISKIRDKYMRSANEIVRDYNDEDKLKKDYSGRQIYELLQNADDEASDLNDGGSVLISLKGNILTISNTGHAFSIKGIKSLMYPNASPKRIHKNKIGCKGLGFRSVLNWSDDIKIKTKEFCVEFSEKIARRFYSEIIKDNPKLLKEIKELVTEEYPIALLCCPNCTDEVLPFSDNYDTAISLVCKLDLIDTIKQEIERLTFEELIFLKNLKKIHIITENQERIIEKIVEGNTVYLNEKNILTQTEKDRLWTVYKKQGKIDIDENQSKEYEFIIAYPDEDIGRENVLYSYFKTDIVMPYPALIHGTFELTSDRNNLLKGEESNNRILVSKLIDFMIETSVNLAEKSNVCDYTPLKLLVSDNSSYILDNHFGFSQMLKEKLKTAKILPTISGKYISINDAPKYSANRFDKYINPMFFDTLLLGTEDEYIRKFLFSIINPRWNRFYSASEFISKINEDIEYYKDIDLKANLIKLFCDEYSFEKVVPHFLVDSYSNLILDNRKVFILDANEEKMQLPKWVNVSFLNSRLTAKLKELYEINSNRQLVEKLKQFNINEYSFKTVYDAIKAQITKDDLTEAQSKEILLWLYEYYSSHDRETDVVVNVKVPLVNGKLEDSRKVYFGKEYHNIIGKKILDIFTEKYIADKDSIGLTEVSVAEAKEFLKWIGIRDFPRINIINLSNSEMREYINYYLEKNKRYVCHDGSYSKEEFNLSCVTVCASENLSVIMEKAKFEDLIAWFMVDPYYQKLQLCGDKEIYPDSKILGRKDYKRYSSEVKSENMPSYTVWLLKNFAWVNTGKGKVKPIECCFKNYGAGELIFEPIVDYKYLKSLPLQFNNNQIKGWLSFLGVADEFCNMDKRQIYKVLFSLPEHDKANLLGKKIYEQLNNVEVIDELVNDNPAYIKFINEGKVLAKTIDGKAYVDSSKVYYSDKRLYSADVLKKFNMFDFKSRAGEPRVNRLFGVHPLKNIKVTISEDVVIHRLNDEFQKCYVDFLPYIYADRITLRNESSIFRALHNMRVYICNELDFNYNVDKNVYKASLKDYESIVSKESKVAYIKVPEAISSFGILQREIKFASAIADILEQILDVSGDSSFYRDLFMKNRSDRDFTMQHDRNDEGLVYLNEARKKFGATINRDEDFWRVLSELLNVECENYEDAKEKIVKKFDIETLVDGFECDKLENDDNVTQLIALFNFLGISLQEYNERTIFRINILSYWRKKWKKLTTEYRSRYISYLIEQVEKSIIDIETFKRLKESYVYDEDIDIANSVSINLEKLFEMKYNISIADLKVVQEKNFDENFKEWRISRKICFDKYENPQDIVELSLYFGKEKFLVERKEGEKSVETIFYPEKAIEGIESIDYTVRNITIEKPVVYEKINDSKIKKSSGVIITHNNQLQKDEDGIKAEKKVYDYLKSLFQDVKWMSGYANKLGINKEATDSNHYDIQYRDNDGEIIFVEVKSTRSNDIEFKISKAEIDFAIRNSKNYEIFVVKHNTEEIFNIGRIFNFDDGEDIFNNSKFYINSDSFSVKAKMVN